MKLTDMTLLVDGEEVDAGKMLLIGYESIRGLFVEATIRGEHHFKLIALHKGDERELFNTTATPVDATGAALLDGYRSYIAV